MHYAYKSLYTESTSTTTIHCKCKLFLVLIILHVVVKENYSEFTLQGCMQHFHGICVTGSLERREEIHVV